MGVTARMVRGPLFLCLAFLRTMQILHLQRSSDSDLAIEVVILRHEVAVLRRQVDRPALRPSDRALFACLSRLIPRAKLSRFFVQPDTLLPASRYRPLIGEIRADVGRVPESPGHDDAGR